jgi:hypothetical protein
VKNIETKIVLVNPFHVLEFKNIPLQDFILAENQS